MVSSISGGTGFLPSTVWQCLKTRDPSKWTVVSVLYFVDLSSHHIFEEANKCICESYICTWNMYRLYSGCFSEEQDERHFGLWAKSHLLMSMDHTANEEASTSNDPMNIGRGMERWRRLVSIPSMNFFLPQCGKTPERTPGRQLRCESSSIQREGGFHKVFTREGLETCCLVSCIGNTRCSDKGWSALGHAVKRKRLCFFLVMRLGGRRVYLAHINDICDICKHPTTSLRQWFSCISIANLWR